MSERTPQEEEKGLEEDSLNGSTTEEQEVVTAADTDAADGICEAVCALMEAWRETSDMGRVLAIRQLKEASGEDTSMIRLALLAVHRREEEPEEDGLEDFEYEEEALED